MSNKLEDLGRSYELAAIINELKPSLLRMDLGYAKAVAHKMRESAGFNDSAAAINPSYDPSKTDLMFAQSQALLKLVEYVELLQKCDQLKNKVADNTASRSELQKLFL